MLGLNIVFNDFTGIWISAFAEMTKTGLNGELSFLQRWESGVLNSNFKIL